MKTCRNCGVEIPRRVVVGGKSKSLQSRVFCLSCSPYGTHNTSPKLLSLVSTQDRGFLPDPIRECKCERCKRTYSYSREQGKTLHHCGSCRVSLHRQATKERCILYKGGECEKCGYNKCPDALHFHHSDPGTKSWGINTAGSKSWEDVKKELDKCELLCSVCHFETEANISKATVTSPSKRSQAVIDWRRRAKLRAIAYKGGSCQICGYSRSQYALVFHHLDPAQKDFTISGKNIKSWTRMQVELDKCILLCSNCHVEEHAKLQADKLLKG